MNEAEVLIGLTQVSIGIAGFSGLVYVLSPAETHRPSTSAFLVLMLANTVLAIFHSLFGIFLQSMIENPWGWGSTFAFVTSIIGTPIILKLASTVTADVSDVPKWIVSILWVPGLSQVVLHLVNSSMFDVQQFGWFFLGQCLLLVTAILLFMYMVVVLVSKNGPDT